MTIGERIKMLREQRDMTQDELAALVGYKHKTSVNKIETGERKLMQDKIVAFAKALRVSPETIMGWADPNDNSGLSPQESQMIDKYRCLDNRGRSTVDTVLDHEYRWVLGHVEEDDFVEYLFLGKVAAAGTWVYPGDIPLERISARRMYGADFIVGVSGDSMQPTFEDGDRVYVKKTTDIEPGDIGLFIAGGYYYIKEFAEDGLHSHNPKYNTIPADAGIIVVGKVLGKV
jgi:repressor LexA